MEKVLYSTIPMPAELVDVAKVLVCNFLQQIVPKAILHKTSNLAAIEERRLSENLLLTPQQRIQKMFLLIEIAQAFRKEPLKKPQGLGLVFKVKR